MTTDKEGVKILAGVLVAKGVKRVVLSPGSRNAPLIVAFAREPRVDHYVVLDERSAAFFALGMVQRSGEPVALVCTSGTALLNYAPAVAEAYYQRLPLIVVSADRPVEWIDQDDSQTIRQRDALGLFVKSSYQLPAETGHMDERWYANRIVNDAVNCAMKGRRGPVHINVPLREPLYGMRDYGQCTERSIDYIAPAPILPTPVMARLIDVFNTCPKVMILGGFHLPDEYLGKALQNLAKLPNVVVLTESLANVGNGPYIDTIDRVLATIPDGEKASFVPDLLITFGGPLVSRHVKTFLRNGHPSRHWSIDCSEHLVDTMKLMTTQIGMDAAGFFPLLASHVKLSGGDYAARWADKKKLAESRHHDYVQLAPWSDLKAFSIIFPALPEHSCLQLGNSTPVRYAQLFRYPQVVRADGNRGTSGIDGSTSTAVGAAAISQGITTLITGDMSFLYDSNGLWNKYLSPGLKIIVIKNGGGAIFRFIPGPSELEELEECFETAQEVDVEGFARLHHFNYFSAAGEEELYRMLPLFYAGKELPSILEVITPRFENDRVLKDYFEYLSC